MGLTSSEESSGSKLGAVLLLGGGAFGNVRWPQCVCVHMRVHVTGVSWLEAKDDAKQPTIARIIWPQMSTAPWLGDPGVEGPSPRLYATINEPGVASVLKSGTLLCDLGQVCCQLKIFWSFSPTDLVCETAGLPQSRANPGRREAKGPQVSESVCALRSLCTVTLMRAT